MRVRLTSDAWRDLAEIGAWIGVENPIAAVELTDALLDKALEIGPAPRRYPVLATLRGTEVRKHSHRGYVILFRITVEVEVLHIVNARRDFLSLLKGS